MDILITFDYELFFGDKTGTVERCLIVPTNLLLDIAKKNNVKFSFFIDVGHFLKLKEFRKKFISLQKDYDLMASQIELLSKKGHDVHLHIHPHWEDCFFFKTEWQINVGRYRLHSFSETEIEKIIGSYKKTLEEIAGRQIYVYRAGGWCIQPFKKIKNAFKKNGIWVDSTVFKNGFNTNKIHYFDFRHFPNKEVWRFEDDPLIESKQGYFFEIPISSLKVSPLFSWKLAFHKKFVTDLHKSYGDGLGIGTSQKNILKMMFISYYTVLSADGYKASLLFKAMDSYKRHKRDLMVIIGHPKMQTRFSLKKIDEFIHINNDKNFITYSQYISKNNIQQHL